MVYGRQITIVTGVNLNQLITGGPHIVGSMVLLYMVTWIPSIYPSHVNICTSTMDPMGYPLVIQHGIGKSYINGVCYGNMSIKGGFPIAMIDHRRVFGTTRI